MYAILVEDNHDDREVTAESLRRAISEEIVVDTVGTADEALDLIATRWPDLLLVDHGLPDMSGLELVRLIRQTHGELPITIMVTGYTEAEHPELGKAVHDGLVDAVLTKSALPHVGRVISRTYKQARESRMRMLTSINAKIAAICAELRAAVGDD